MVAAAARAARDAGRQDQEKALRVVAADARAGGAADPAARSGAGRRGGDRSSTSRPACTSIGLAVTSGLACLGPDRGKRTCLVLREDWLGKLPRFDRDAALAELARRYLRRVRARHRARLRLLVGASAAAR